MLFYTIPHLGGATFATSLMIHGVKYCFSYSVLKCLIGNRSEGSAFIKSRLYYCIQFLSTSTRNPHVSGISKS